MKKILGIILITLLCAIPMFAGGSKESSDSSQLKIAIVCSGAGQNDNGYNQSAVDGAKDFAASNDVEYKVVEPTNGVPSALETLAEDGYNLIFSLEYDFDALIKGVGGAKPIAEQYPDTTFVIFNDNPNVDANGNILFKNVYSVLFDVHEGSFLAGMLSVEVIENYENLFGNEYNLTSLDNGGRTVGFVGGTNSNGIIVFSDGFVEGMNYAAKNYGVKYNYLKKNDAGFADPAVGSTIAGTFYNNGANVIFGVAGGVGDGITAKAKEIGKLAIQVDANKDNQQPGYILTSVLKNTKVPVETISKAYIAGTLKDMKNLQTYNLASGATGITDLAVIEKHVSDKALLDLIKAKVNAAKDKISSGLIIVSNAQEGEILDSLKVSNINFK